MKKLSSFFLIVFMLNAVSCGPSDIIVNIYRAAQYNCTTSQYRLLKDNRLISFLKVNKWYSREKFHEAHREYTLSHYKDLPMSEETLDSMTPSVETSTAMFDELVMGVDCENPKDLLF